MHGQLPRNGPSRQPISSATPLCKSTDNPPDDVTSNIATTATVGTSDAAPVVDASAAAPTVGASAAAPTIPTTNTAHITFCQCIQFLYSTCHRWNFKSSTCDNCCLKYIYMNFQCSPRIVILYKATMSPTTMTPTTMTSVVTPTPEASTSTADINSAIITTAEIDHQKKVFEDYTVVVVCPQCEREMG